MPSIPLTYNRILVEVVIGAPSDGVELNEVVKCGDLSPHPLLLETRLLEEASWLLNANTIKVGRSKRDYLTIHFTNHLLEEGMREREIKKSNVQCT